MKEKRRRKKRKALEVFDNLIFVSILTNCMRCFTEAYLRTKRLYILVPLSCLILFLLFSALPSFIWSFSYPRPPSPAEVSRSILLAAALWCLSHCLRVPTFALTSSVLPVILSTVLRRRRRAVREKTVAWTPYIHTTLFVTLQESLRLTSFYILELHWSSAPSASFGQNKDEQMHVFDRTFRVIWFLALGWALAEVCAGIVQGYEQLALYSDVESVSTSAPDRLDLVENCVSLPLGEHFEEGSLDDVRLSMAGGVTHGAAEERVFQAIPCVAFDSDSSDLKGKTGSRGVMFSGRRVGEEDPEILDLDAAITHLSNIKAREDLEAIYGAPFVRIPVFVTILQRVDSILLSLGVTLTIGFAYLCDQSRSTNALSPSTSSENVLLGATHWHALLPTFIVLTFIHICLGILHTPAILSRIGVHVAAYIACLVGLGLVFAGVGMWVGLW